jgi:hypothetical protein
MHAAPCLQGEQIHLTGISTQAVTFPESGKFQVSDLRSSRPRDLLTSGAPCLRPSDLRGPVLPAIRPLELRTSVLPGLQTSGVPCFLAFRPPGLRASGPSDRRGSVLPGLQTAVAPCFRAFGAACIRAYCPPWLRASGQSDLRVSVHPGPKTAGAPFFLAFRPPGLRASGPSDRRGSVLPGHRVFMPPFSRPDCWPDCPGQAKGIPLPPFPGPVPSGDLRAFPGSWHPCPPASAEAGHWVLQCQQSSETLPDEKKRTAHS